MLSAYVTATVGSALIFNGDEEVLNVGDTLYHDATTGLAHRSSLVGLDRLLGGEVTTSHEVSLQATKFDVGTDTYTVVSANENQYPSANVAFAAIESALSLRGRLQSTAADDWMEDGDFDGLLAAADYAGEDVSVTEFTAYDALQLVKKQFPGSLAKHGDLTEYQGVPVDASNENGSFAAYLGALAAHFRSYGVDATPDVELRHGERGVEIDFVIAHRKTAYTGDAFTLGMDTLTGPLSMDIGRLSLSDEFHFGTRSGALRTRIRDVGGEHADDLFDAYARIPGDVGEGNKLTASEYANPVLSRRRMKDLRLAFNPTMKAALGYESFGKQDQFLSVLMDGQFAPEAVGVYTLTLYKPARQ